MALSRAILDAKPLTELANPKCRQSKSMQQIEAARAALTAWEAVKAFIAKRDSYRCRLCGKGCRYGDPITTRADAHHIIFKSAGGEDVSWNLIYLCRGCHDLVHKVRRFFLSGNADDRDPAGKGCVKVERQAESGFDVVGFI